MRKSLFPIALLGLSSFAYTQVGINTDAPKATLHIVASPLNEEKIDGVLLPKLSGDDLRAKSELYQVDQHGALVYVTEADTQPTDKTENVISPGFYFYDHGLQKWTKLGENSGIANHSNIWRIQNTETPATANTDNVYLNGKLGLGFTKDDEVSERTFEVKGDIKVQNENNGFYNLFETNTPSFLSGLPSIQLLTTENTDIFQSEKISGILADPIIFSAFNTNPSANSSTAITLQEGNFSLSTSEQPQGAGYWMSHASGGVDGMFLAYQKNSFPQGTGIEKRREIAVNDYSGIRFLFIEKEKNISQEGYYFPLNSGEKGQVLTVGDATPGNSMKINQLVWKYPGTIPMHNIPTYADDAAADADANLESGALYKLNGSRAVYQKP